MFAGLESADGWRKQFLQKLLLTCMWCQMYIAEQFPSCLATPDAMLDVHTTIFLHLLHSFFAVSWRARGRRWLPPPLLPPLPLISAMFRFIPQKSNVSPLTPLFFLASPQFTSWSWPSSSFFCFPPPRLLYFLPYVFLHSFFLLFIRPFVSFIL